VNQEIRVSCISSAKGSPQMWSATFGDTRDLTGNVSMEDATEHWPSPACYVMPCVSCAPFCCIDSRVAYVRDMAPPQNKLRAINLPFRRFQGASMSVPFDLIFRHFAGRCARWLEKVAKRCANTLVSITRRKPRFAIVRTLIGVNVLACGLSR